MRTLKILLLLVCGLLVGAGSVQGQTVSYRIGWSQPLVADQTFTDVQTYTYSLKVGTTAPVPVTATCTNGSPISCVATVQGAVPLGQPMVLTVSNGLGSTPSLPYTPNAPAAPTQFKIVIIINNLP